jgi:hypothetical protein
VFNVHDYKEESVVNTERVGGEKSNTSTLIGEISCRCNILSAKSVKQDVVKLKA